jgi:tetratricopeptide (TPR) repeat protein
MARVKNKPKPKTEPARKPLRPAVFALLIFAAAWAVYWNSLDGQFVFDDTSIIENNPQIRGLGVSHLKQIFGSHYWQTAAGQGGLYRPLVVFSYALNYAAGGLDPWGYHAVNVLLHALNAVLVFSVILELFANRSFALWSGLLFALHPIRTEAVAYVVGRAESMAAFFFLLAWWLYLRRQPAISAAAFLLAVLSKESAFTFLALPLLSDFLTARRPSLIRYLPFAGAAAAALGLRRAVLGGFAPLHINPAANPLAAAPAAARLLTATVVCGKYLWLLLFPMSLSADYSFNQIPLVTSPWRASFLFAAAALLSLAGATVWAFRRGAKEWFFCGTFFLATFSLTSNFIRPIGTIMGERLLYLPSLGFTCALAYGISRIRKKEAAIGGAVLLSLFYAGRTMVRNADWRDHLALFSSAAAVCPDSSLVQANLANALLFLRRDPAAAAEHARKAIRIEPGDPAAHMTLAEAYQRMGDLRRAADAYADVVRLAPGTAGGLEAARRREAILKRLQW